MKYVVYLYLHSQGDEFQRSIDVSQYQLFRGNEVFVMWNWIWIDGQDYSSEGSVINSDPLFETTAQ